MKKIFAVLTVALLQGLAILALSVSQDVRAQTDTSPHTEHFVQINGVTLHYLDWGGKGEPLVFLTGYGAPAHVFDALAPRFTDAFRVVALTRRGRAPSQAPASGYDFDTLTADVKGVLDALKFRRVHIVAHSFGGSEATRLATFYPDRIASVVYLDAALDAAAGEAAMKESPVPNPQLAPGTPYAQVLQWWTSYSPDFSKVRSRALAFYALQDNPPVPPNASEELRQRANEYWRTRWLPTARQMIEKFKRELPTARVVVLENASHYLFRDREADVVREMNDFYASFRR
jgi:pimeloyl-ACP methyl ester carboxylesterase